MDAKIWFYILVGIVYVVVTFLKKKKVPTENYPGTPERDSAKPFSEKPKPLTFEELLREITEAKEPQKPVYQAPARQEYVDYDEQIGEEAKDLEVVEENEYQRRSRVYREYEDAREKAFERPSLEETMNVRNTDVHYGKFKAFDQNQQRNLLAEYTKDLKDPEGFKKAFVMSEILNRKF
jgi:hypothetical protein